jgi:hypothetical protein
MVTSPTRAAPVSYAKHKHWHPDHRMFYHCPTESEGPPVSTQKSLYGSEVA